MVKNFSVDWLAQSFHDSKQNPEPMEASRVPERRHVPCLVQPRGPTSYNKVYIQPKSKCIRTEPKSSTEDLKENISALRNCTSPSNSENSGYSSGYESEATASEYTSIEDVNEIDSDNGAQRRIRTKFTPEQIEKLEKIFSKHKYLDASERVKTAQKLNLSETQVRTWFQNRRMKQKREVQEMRSDYALPVLPHVLLPVSSLPFHCYNGQRASFPAASHIPHPHVSQPLAVHCHPIQEQQIIPQHGHPIFHLQHYY